jgi:DNA-binding MarR family transcriptional regulator
MKVSDKFKFFGASGKYTSIPNEAIEHAAELGLSAPKFQVLVFLMKYCWKGKMTCYTAKKKIAKALGYHHMSIRRIIKDLETDGLITIEYNGPKDRCNKATCNIEPFLKKCGVLNAISKSKKHS